MTEMIVLPFYPKNCFVSGVARQVYRCALYIYAAEGVIPEPYNHELMDGAWRIRKS